MAENLVLILVAIAKIESRAGLSKGGKNYRSEFCATSEGASLEECACGHPDCE